MGGRWRSGAWLRWLPLCGVAAAVGGLVAIVLLVAASQAQIGSGPKRLANAQATDCAACHGAKTPLPPNHPAVAGLKLAQCVGCHAEGSAASLVQKIPLSHLHALSGIGCANCHGTAKQREPVAAEQCITCHAPDAIVAATAKVKPTNPHNSPHYGKDADCNLCHHAHEKSENYCAQCHNFNFAVP